MTITNGSTGVGGLEIDRDGHTLLCVVDRPPDNLFSGSMIDALIGAIKGTEGNPNTRFVRLRARGDAFCRGRDRTATSPREFQEEAARIVAINELFKSTPLTVAVELRGDAAGFGAGLVGSADIVVAAEARDPWRPRSHGRDRVAWVRGAVQARLPPGRDGRAHRGPRSRAVGLGHKHGCQERGREHLGQNYRPSVSAQHGGTPRDQVVLLDDAFASSASRGRCLGGRTRYVGTSPP
jgi:hypothetical protein